MALPLQLTGELAKAQVAKKQQLTSISTHRNNIFPKRVQLKKGCEEIERKKNKLLFCFVLFCFVMFS